LAQQVISFATGDRQVFDAGEGIRITLLNRFDALGTAEIVRISLHKWGKGMSRLKPELRNNAICSR